MLKVISVGKRLDRYEFIWKAIQKHGYKYDYRKVEYKNIDFKVCIICHKHGEFWQAPRDHLKGNRCVKCYYDTISHNRFEFIENAEETHGNKYDYSKTEYKGSKTKVCIICKEHGEFWQMPYSHLNGKGCSRCVGRDKTTEDFIKDAKLIHGERNDYSKVEYVGSHNKVCIICPIHGEFYQTPHGHLNGNNCPICANKRNVSENKLLKLLKEHFNIVDCQKHFKWLGKQSLDFYLPEYNIAIEYQGEQHFKSINIFGGEDRFKYQNELDIKKNKLCKENNVVLFYFSFNESLKNITYIDNINTNITELITKIKTYSNGKEKSVFSRIR